MTLVVVGRVNGKVVKVVCAHLRDLFMLAACVLGTS